MSGASGTVREVEMKFRVHPAFELPALNGNSSVASVAGPTTQQLRAVYWDTADLRLAREGITLRHRIGEGAGDGWHLKLPVNDDGIRDSNIAARDEIHHAGPDDEVPPSFTDLLTVYLRGAVLGPVATLVTSRSSYQLCGVDNEAVAELTDDVVEVLKHGRVAVRFREIEVEDRGGGIDVLTGVATTLRAAGGVAGEFVAKVVRALGPQATADPDPPPPGNVGLDEPVQALIRTTLRRHVRILMARDLDVRCDVADGVHQMRVNARRLRTALKVFRPFLEVEWAEGLRRELGWLADELGGARDAEVMLARLLRGLDELPTDLDVSKARAKLRTELGADLGSASERTIATLHSERYIALVDRLVDAAWDPLTVAGAAAPVATAAPQVLDKAWRRLARRADRVRRDDAGDDDWHQARIAAKQVRYACEAAAVVYGRPARRLAARAEDVQELLGEHQDAVVAADVVRRLAASQRGGTVPFVLGLLFAQQQDAIARARDEFPKLWKGVSKPKHRKWLRS